MESEDPDRIGRRESLDEPEHLLDAAALLSPRRVVAVGAHRELVCVGLRREDLGRIARAQRRAEDATIPVCRDRWGNATSNWGGHERWRHVKATACE